MQLDVGNLDLGMRLQEAAAFGELRCDRAAPLATVLPDPASQTPMPLADSEVKWGLSEV